LFGRTAAPLMEPVQDWFVTQGKEVAVAQLSLADSHGVWAAIEELLSARQATDFMASGWKPSARSASQNAGLVDAGESLRFDLGEYCAPSLSNPAPSPERAFDAPVALTASGKQWLASLLEIDAVRAVGVQCGPDGPSMAIVGHAPGLSDADRQLSEQVFKTCLSSETGQHAQLALAQPGEQHMLTLFDTHFSVSCTVSGPVLTVLLVQFARGYTNQGMAQSALNAGLRQLHEPLFT
jgi:hypothetical protein